MSNIQMTESQTEKNGPFIDVLRKVHPNGQEFILINHEDNTDEEGFVLTFITSLETVGDIKGSQFLPYQYIKRNGVNLLEQFTFKQEDGIAYRCIKEHFTDAELNLQNLHSMRNQSDEKIEEVLGTNNDEVLEIRYCNIVQYMGGTVGLRYPFASKF